MQIGFRPTVTKGISSSIETIAGKAKQKASHTLNGKKGYTDLSVPAVLLAMILTGAGIATCIDALYYGKTQDESFEKVKYDPDLYNCQKGHTLSLEKTPLSDMLIKKHFNLSSANQSFLCDDRRTIVYNLFNGTKTTTMPTELLQGAGIHGLDTITVTRSLDSVIKNVAKSALANMR